MTRVALVTGILLTCLSTSPALSQQPQHDDFFWLGEINKASAVINADQGLLDRGVARRKDAGS